jgi:hypothetical protein
MDTFDILREKIKQKGFSLIEFIVVMGMAITMAGGAVYQSNLRQNDLKVEKFIEDHKLVISSVNDVGNSLSDYFISGNDWSNVLVSSQSLPVGMTSVGVNKFSNVFGGTLMLTAQEFMGPGSGGSFPGIPMIQMEYTNIPKNACVKFAARVAADSYDFQVNGSRVALLGQPDLSTVDLQSAVNNCNQAVNKIVVTNLRSVPFLELSNVSNYSCPAGQTLQGAICLQTTTTTTPATLNYSCVAPDVLIGANCQSTTTYSGTPNYGCTTGVQVGALCDVVTQFPVYTYLKFDCPAVGTVPAVFLPFYGAQATTPAPYFYIIGLNAQYTGKPPYGGDYNCYNYYNGVWTLYAVSTPSPVYVCTMGGVLSGSNCISTATSPTTIVSYSCPSGGYASGSSCININSVPATNNYTCPAGQTVVGANCKSTIVVASAAASQSTSTMGATLGLKYSNLLSQRRMLYQ